MNTTKMKFDGASNPKRSEKNAEIFGKTANNNINSENTIQKSESFIRN